jgi:hydroxymethylbilane synthase
VQCDLVAAAITAHHPNVEINIHAMDPLGDRDKTTALYKLSDGTAAKSVWTGEFEDMLQKNELDVIVHSLKDLATAVPEGLVLAAVLEREDSRDVIVLRQTSNHPGEEMWTAKSILDSLPAGAIVGTSSLRRIAQLRRNWPHLRYEVLRGNVPTRLRKLDFPAEFDPPVEYAAAIVAAAGLIRLDLAERIDAFLGADEVDGSCMYAVGQGAIGIEARENDEKTRKVLDQINHRETWLAVMAERSLLRALEGGCSVPIGVETKWEGKKLVLKAAVVSVDGKIAIESDGSAVIDGTEGDNQTKQAEELGAKVAKILIDDGASVILDAINEERKQERDEEAKVQDAAAAGIV